MDIIKYFIVFFVVAIHYGCAGSRTFHDVAMAGDTVAIAAGWKHYFSTDNITVTVTPSVGADVTLPPSHPSIRAVTNLYADPMSSIVLSDQLGLDLTQFATTYADTIHTGYTGDDKEWWQTVVFLDLPSSLPTGITTISITNPDGETATATLNIVPGSGSPNPLSAHGLGDLTTQQLASLQRYPYYYTVDFAGTTVPYAIQVDMTHDTSVAAYVVNPIGHVKNAAWADDGLNTRVILTPSKDSSIKAMSDYKIYVAAAANLNIVSLEAFDMAGSPVSGITATVTPSPSMAALFP